MAVNISKTKKLQAPCFILKQEMSPGSGASRSEDKVTGDKGDLT